MIMETSRDLAALASSQQGTIEELETPVIEVWDGILALPIVGTVDTVRAQSMTERLLRRSSTPSRRSCCSTLRAFRWLTRPSRATCWKQLQELVFWVPKSCWSA